MPIIVWDGSISIGHVVIDEQHKKLVDIINKLHAAIIDGSENEILQSIFKELYNYSLYHFKEEEYLMDIHYFKHKCAHQFEHQSFVNDLATLSAKIMNGESNIGVETLDWLTMWLRNHIAVTDKKLATCLRNH